MLISTERLVEQISRDDPAHWQVVQDLLHHLGGVAAEADRAGDIPSSLWSRVPVGLLNRMNMPVEYGGLALTASALRRAVVFEQVGRVCPGLPIGMPGPGLSMPPVHALGTPAQRDAYFRRFLAEDRPVWGAFAITEPEAGSDATALRTTATRDGDGYVLNGSKCFITSGQRADAVVVFASLDRSKGRFGIRAFVVERGTPGFAVDRCEDMMGLRASQLASLSFTDCRVPSEWMLGHNGKRGPLIDAFTGAQSAWDYMRPALSAGINGACFGMIDHAWQCMAGGGACFSAAQTRAVEDELALFRARVESAQLLALRAAWKYDSGQRASLDASMAKAFSSTLAMELAHRLSTLFGCAEPRARARFDKFYRDAKAFDILEGTGDMQRLMISRAFDTTLH